MGGFFSREMTEVIPTFKIDVLNDDEKAWLLRVPLDVLYDLQDGYSCSITFAAEQRPARLLTRSISGSGGDSNHTILLRPAPASSARKTPLLWEDQGDPSNNMVLCVFNLARATTVTGRSAPSTKSRSSVPRHATHAKRPVPRVTVKCIHQALIDLFAKHEYYTLSDLYSLLQSAHGFCQDDLDVVLPEFCELCRQPGLYMNLYRLKSKLPSSSSL